MRRRDLLLAAGAAMFGASAFPLTNGWAADKKTRRVLYFTRNVGFYHSVVQRKGDQLSHSERIMIEMGKRAGLEIECSKDGRLFEGDLSRYEAFALYANGDLTEPNPQQEPPMSAEGKKRFLEAIAAGKGCVGFHSTCNCWPTPGPAYENNDKVDPFIAMLGAQFIAHGPQQKATMRVTSPKFPGLKGLGDSFEMLEEWYAMKNFAKDLHVILVQETAGMQGDCYQRPPFPSTWARMQGQGRVFFTSLAHREDVWEGATLQQIVLGGLAWVLGDVTADVTPNMDQVTPQAGKLKA